MQENCRNFVPSLKFQKISTLRNLHGFILDNSKNQLITKLKIISSISKAFSHTHSWKDDRVIT